MAVAVLRLAHAGVQVSLRLEDDPRRERRALAHGGGFALSHAGQLAPGPTRELVIAIGRGFAGHGALDLDDAIAALQAIAIAIDPQARLTRARVAPGGRALPRWSSRLRTGAPRLTDGSIWPFDAEMAGLRLGARRIAKRECFDDDAEAADRAWLVAQGAVVARVGAIDPDGRRVLLAALDPAALDDGALAEAALRGRDREGPARALGAVLGYPPCCVDAFIAAEGRDDLSLLSLLPADAAPAPPWTQWLNAPLALISHTPCTLTCGPTIALAQALCAELDRASPGFSSAWRALAARFQIVDHRGRGLAIRGRGSLASGVVIDHALALEPDPAGVVARELPELTGCTVRVGDELDPDGPTRTAALGADHTGA